VPSNRLGEFAAVFEGIETTPANLDPGVGEPYRLIQCCDLMGGRAIARRRLKEVYFDPAEVPGHLEVQAGDILVGLAGAEIPIVRVRTMLAWCVPDSNVAVIRTPSEALRTRVLDYLRSARGLEQLKSLQQGNVVKRLRLRDLGDLDVPIE
jgi:hypothetical protein